MAVVYWQSLTLQNESMEMTIEQDRKTILSLQGELGETVDYDKPHSVDICYMHGWLCVIAC